MRSPICCSATRRADRSRSTREIDNYVNYFSGYIQDDYRVTDRLTVNYGMRLEHETGLAERNNQLAVGFDTTTPSPLNVTIPAGLDPLHPAGAAR